MTRPDKSLNRSGPMVSFPLRISYNMARNKSSWRCKKNGKPKMYLCSCMCWDCDSFMNVEDFKSIAGRKMAKRKELGLCIGCGHKECTCKNKGR